MRRPQDMAIEQQPGNSLDGTLWFRPLAGCFALVLTLLWASAPLLADIGDPDPYCYAVSDGGNSLLYIHKDGTAECAIGVVSDGDTINNIESISFDPRTETLYVANEDAGGDGVFGTVDATQTCAAGGPTVPFTAINATGSFGTCDLDGDNVGDVALTDPDSIHFDDVTDVMWAVHRDDTDFDVLFQIDLSTGTFVADAFDLGGGTIVDCVRVTGPTLPAGVDDIDDIAVDPTTGILYGVANNGGVDDFLVIIETTGADAGLVADVTRFYSAQGVVFDMEGLSFSTDGEMFGTTGSGSVVDNSLWSIDLESAETTLIATFTTGTDHESVACLTDNVVSGTVFFDVDGDGFFEPADGDSGFEGVTVRLYRDDGSTPDEVDGGDTLLFTTDTGVSGTYLFRLAVTGDFVLDIDTGDLPANGTLTTDNLEEADFAAVSPFYGNTDGGNDFGFERPLTQGDLRVVKTSSVAPGSAVPGQTITYTLTVTNTGSDLLRNVVVTDLLPPGVSYVAESTTVTGFEAGSLVTVASDNWESGGYAGGAGWSASWMEINEADGAGAGDEQVVTDLGDLSLQVKDNNGGGEGVFRQVDLATAIEAQATFDWRRTNCCGSGSFFDNVNDYVTFDVSVDGGTTWVERARFAGPTTADELYQPYPPAPTGFGLPARPVTFPQTLAADTRIRFLSSPFLGNADVLRVDNVVIQASFPTAVTLDNIPAGANSDLAGGAAPNLVAVGDGLILAAGASMTVTFQVTVDDPLDTNVTELVNTGIADCDECAQASDDTVNDPVSQGAILGDRVWLDVDGDGVQDIGEPGIANVELTLFDTGLDGMVGGGDDVLIGTTTTDLDGGYLFTHIYPGVGPYYVDVTDASVPSGLVLTAGGIDPSATVTVTGADTFLDLDFGYTSPTTTAVVGDFVWSDADNDGIQDPGEPGIGGVAVDLVTPGVDGIFGTVDDVVVLSTTTADDGRYLFTGVPPGEYAVDVDETSAAILGDSLTSGPQSQSDPSSPITVAAGEVYLDADFGYFDAAKLTITDTVWRDLDEDGVLDVGEEGFVGVTISLLDGDGDVIATTTTDANGGFSFSGLEAGSYTLEITDTANVLSGFGGTTTFAQNRQRAVNAGDSNESFGFNAEGRVGDVFWSDADGDGVRDPGEPGIAGVTVNLVDPGPDEILGNGDDVVLATTTSDATGAFLFTGVERGDFLTVVTDTGAALTGYTQTGDPDLPGVPCSPSCDAEGTATVPRGGEDLTMDFGYQNTALPDVSGNVWEDIDTDGLDDGAGEPGIAGVTVALVNASGVTVATTTTDGNGDYSFPDVAAGDYTVEVTDQDGVLTGYQLTSGLDQIPITVLASDITDVDFGYVREPGNGSIGDFVWLDGDGDGIQDGAENGIAGVTVELYDPGPDGAPGGGDDVLLATTVTDLGGHYRFTGLMAGAYFAQVDSTTLPGGGAGLMATTANPTAPINLSEGEDYDQADFGFGSTVAVAGLGDFVWYDADSDGVQDPGEVGIGGVEIQITGPGCAPCTTTTAADGSYLFTSLTPGDFSITYDPLTLPAGYNTVATNGDPQFSSPGAGEIDPSIDFGFDAPGGTTGTIGDFVWLDVDGDGVQDGGEPGIGGVTLNLLDDATGNILATTITDSSGAYDFVGVPAGSYRVAVSDLFGALDGLALSGGTNPTATIVLAAGGDHDSADFGYETTRGSIGNLVWHDSNGDGDRDAGESGLSGVTVQLWQDTNGNGSIDAGTDNLVRETITNQAGEYEFTGLVAGDYLVTVSDRNGILTGFDTLTSGSAGVDNNSQADPYAVTLATGDDNVTADFGYFDSSSANNLSGLTYFDLDGDGVIDGGDDLGVGRVLVLLFKDLDGDGVLDPEDALIGSQESVFGGASQGEYEFLNLPDGDYIVAVDATGTFLDGGIQTTQLGTAAVQPATIAGADSVNNDFGFHLRATVVVVSEFSAFVDGGQVVVEWQTAAESNSTGFDLYRWDAEGSDYVQVNQSLVPTLFGAPQGGVYRLIDPLASPSGELSYLLVEKQARGIDQVYGPYTLEVDWRSAVERRAPAVGQFEAEPHRPTVEERLRGRAERAEAARSANLKRKAAVQQVKIKVLEEGLQYVSLEDLAELFELEVGAVQEEVFRGRLSLRHRGVEVAWLAAENLAGIYFYGEGIRSLYTTENIYLVQLEEGSPMEQQANGSATAVPVGSFRTSIHFEQDTFAGTLVARDPDADYWHWKGLSAGHPTLGQHTFLLEVKDPAPSGSDAVLQLAVRGASESVVAAEHHATVRVNGSPVGETSWDGLSDHTASFSFPHSLLIEGNNAVEVTALLDSGAEVSFFYVDSFDIEYQRLHQARNDELLGVAEGPGVVTVDGFSNAEITVFDLEDKKRPVWLVDATTSVGMAGFQVSFMPLAETSPFLAVDLTTARVPELEGDLPSNLRTETHRANYLLVTNGTLAGAAEELAEHRRSQGWEAMVVEVEDVMDEFNDGIFDPNSLREFFAYAHGAWQLPPQAVVLVGAGNFDYRDIFDLGGNVVPPLMVGTPFGLYASDSRLVDVEGDTRPEMQIGRLPVMTAAELEAVTAKIVAHESGQGEWTGRVTLAADDGDLGGNFSLSSEGVAAHLGGFEVERIYLDEIPFPAARERLLAEIEEGVAWVNYLGHGGIDRLTDSGLLITSDVDLLTNSDRLFLLTSLTCNVARFEIPGFSSLAESLVLDPDGGAAAVWAPSGLALNFDSQVLGEAFAGSFANPQAQTLGDAIQAALEGFAVDGHYPFVAQVYTLVGDPAMILRRAAVEPPLFSDGFESGDFSAWSAVVP